MALTRHRILLIYPLLLLSLYLGGAAHADIVGVVPVLPAAPGGTLLQSLTQSVATSRFSGTLRWSVYDGPEPGRNLDFYWQFTNDPTSLEEIAVISGGDPIAFPAATGLFQTPTPFGIFQPGTTPTEGGTARNLQIDFRFIFETPILPGQTSNILIARTTAQDYSQRQVVSLSSPGTSASVSLPGLPVPEPGTLAFLAVGLLALAGRSAHRRFRN